MLFQISKMKKWYGGVVIASLFMLLVLRYCTMTSPIENNYLANPLTINSSSMNPIEWLQITIPDFMKEDQKNTTNVISIDAAVSSLYAERNISNEERESLQIWNLLKHLVDHPQGLPNGLEAIKEAGSAWNNLMASVGNESLGSKNENSTGKGNEKQCPQFVKRMNVTEDDSNGFRLSIPCGLTQGSSITIIGIPNGLLGNFRIDLTGEQFPGELGPPIILHYNVRLLGDEITEDPVIVQNTWTVSHDWGDEERCPSPSLERIMKVDELDQCNQVVGKEVNRSSSSSSPSIALRSENASKGSRPKRYFPFKQGYLSVATLRVGSEGMQMSVDGKHITSFAFRETLEPWLVSEVRISGDLKLISVLASSLPTSEESDHVADLETLKAPRISPERSIDLFIGVFSTANNFKRRMSIRRTWMQYDAVRSGTIAVRFFVGLHKNHIVNQELWNEARTYGDIQLMPFVDYYSLISWKTLAICIFGTEVVSARFVMKTDDDAFVRVDEVLISLASLNVTRGLLYGLINSDSQPIRNPDSKWYISIEDWPEESYPPWAHGPGYVVSHDIAKSVYQTHKYGSLKMFKLEDVAMGIWISELKKQGLEVRYEKDGRIMNDGCKDGYVVAHYQSPGDMICLWRKLQETKRGFCCGDF